MLGTFMDFENIYVALHHIYTVVSKQNQINRAEKAHSSTIIDQLLKTEQLK